MAENKTKPTEIKVEEFLKTVSPVRQEEALSLIDMLHEITGEKPVMWGPTIIGFGSQHYKYDTGREGDMPKAGFSPRKASITIYFNEGFQDYGDLMTDLGKHKASVSCLYINKLADVDLIVLRQMLESSYKLSGNKTSGPTTVDEYIAAVPTAAREKFDELRELAKSVAPSANEVLSYGIVGYKIDEKRARVFVSGWKDHVAVYPVPKDEKLQEKLKPYIKGKGTLWFSLNEPLPKVLIKETMKALIKA